MRPSHQPDWTKYTKAKVKEEALLLLRQLKGPQAAILGLNAKNKTQLTQIWTHLNTALSHRGTATMCRSWVPDFESQLRSYDLGAQLPADITEEINGYKAAIASMNESYDSALNV